MTLAPEIKKFLEASAAAGLPQVWEAPVSVLRKNTQGRVAIAGPIEPLSSIENLFIPGPTSDLPIRIYRPVHKSERTLIYFHGGGWVLNFLDIYDASLSRLANQSKSTIVSVNYQKAPEHPYPTPFDDCYATLEWVLENSEKMSLPHTVGVAGDSAGGNLAAAVALKARDMKIALSFQLLIYPCLDRDFSTNSYREKASGFGLSTQAMQWFWDQYLQGNAHDHDPYALPLRSQSLKGVAPAVVITAEYDPLLTDGEKYVAALHRDSIHVVYRNYEGMIHGFFTNLAVTPSATLAIDWAAAEISKITQ